MKYPMFKVHIQVDDALERIKKVLESGYLNEGTEVAEFKCLLQKYLDHKFIIPMNSCTSAITTALKMSGVCAGTEVITTSMTCVATNTPIISLGAKPVWADIKSKTGNIDPSSVISSITKNTRAILCVNWAGLPCELEALHNIAKRYDLKLIQDAAHSFGSMYNGKHVCKYADFTCYSFQAIKHITCGDGGLLTCLDEQDYLRANKFKWFGYDRDAAKDEKGEWKGQRWELDVKEAGCKFNMNNISAAVGLSNVKYFKKIVNSHKRNASTYKEIFKNNKNITPLVYPEGSDPAFWVYTVILNPKIDRDYVIDTLNKRGIAAGLVHVPNHDYSCFHDSLVKLRETNHFNSHQVSLPVGWWLTKKDIKFIANELSEICL